MANVRDEGIGIKFTANTEPLVRANKLTDKFVDKWRIINRELEKSGDTTSFSRGMQRASDSISKTASLADRNYNRISESVSRTTDKVMRLGDATKLSGKRFKVMGDSASAGGAKVTSSLGKIDEKSAATGRTFLRTGKQAGSMWSKIAGSAKSSDANSKILETKSHMQGLGRQATETGEKAKLGFGKATESAKHARTAYSRLSDAGSRLTNISTNISMAMLPVAAAFKKSADEATKLENKYMTIRNLLHTGGESAGASKAETRAMERENNKFALQYGVSPVDMSKGGEELVRRGYSGSQELAAHKYFLQASRASGDSYNSVVGYGAPALEQFGYKTKAGDSKSKMSAYTKKVLNQMAYGADLSATNFSGIGEALKYAGATAHSANQSLAGTIGSIGVLSNNGMDGSIAGTGLRKDLNSLLSPSSGPKGQGEKALKSIGLSPDSLRDSKNNLMSLDRIFVLLNSHMKGMTDTQKATIFHKLFGATGQESALILSKNVNQLKSLTNQVGKAENQAHGRGYISDLSQKNMKSWQNQIAVFKQYINVMGLGFTKTVLPGFTSMLKLANGVLATLIKLPKSAKELIGSITAVSSALGAAYISSRLFRKSTNWLSGSRSSKTNSVANTISQEAGDVAGTGSRMGGTHYSGKLGAVRNAWNGTSGLTKIAIAGTAVDVGATAAKSFRMGVSSKGGAQEMWQAAGKATGGTIGGILTDGNPYGIILGEQVGNAFTKTAKVKYFVQPSKNQDNRHNAYKHVDPHHSPTLHSASENSWQGDASIAATMAGRNGGSGKAHKKLSQLENDYNKLPDSVAKYVRKASKLEQQGNTEWAMSAGKTTGQLKKTYSSLYSLASKQAKSQVSNATKGYAELRKMGLLSSSAASKATSNEKSSMEKRLSNLRSNLNHIVNSEKISAKTRYKDINRINNQIIAITDKGMNKQKALMGSILSSNNKLTAKGFRNTVRAAEKNEKQTESAARKTYNAEVRSANKRYAKAKKLAKELPGLSEEQRKKVVAKAKKQRDQTVARAQEQEKSTVAAAERQKNGVIRAAEAEAGAAANAFKKGAKYVSDSIPALIEQNSGVFGGHYSKVKTSDQAVAAAHADPGAKLRNASRRHQNHSAKISLPKSAFAFANGNASLPHNHALFGEAGVELGYSVNGKRVRLLGANGPEFAKLRPGEKILNARNTRKVLSGNYGRVLPGYASGNTGLGNSAAKKSVNSIVKTSKKDWAAIESDTKKHTRRIHKSTVADFGKTHDQSVSKINQLRRKNKSEWSTINGNTDSLSNKMRKNGISNTSSMKNGIIKNLKAIRNGSIELGQKAATGYGNAMGKMKSYSHHAMSGAISELNSGIKGIDRALGQFGGNSSVITPIKYAKGSNGEIDSNQIAMVNDATSGPRQEGIVHNGQVIAPTGKNKIVPISKGDSVLNGDQFNRYVRAGGSVNRYAKGSGVSHSTLKKLISANNKHPYKWMNDTALSSIKRNGSALQSGISGSNKGALSKFGNPWSKEVWSQMNDARSGGGSGAGGSWRNNPGMAMTDPFGASRAGMYGAGAKHDGTDYSSSLGSSILAMHGGQVIKTGGTGIKDLGDVIIVKSDDGFKEIYQEFGNMGNIKVKTGDQIHTGQKIATLGSLNGSGNGSHVHVGVTKGNPLHMNMLSTSGWYNPSKMKGTKSTSHSSKHNHKSAISRLVAREIAPQLKWVAKNLQDDGGSIGSFSMNGSQASKIRAIADGFRKIDPNATTNGIAAVIGNWLFESALNPSVTNSIGATGLGQWLGGRASNLHAYARQKGKSWKDPALQIEFAYNKDGSRGILKSVLNGKGSVSDLAYKFSRQWEVGGYDAQHVAGARKASAVLDHHARGGLASTNKASVVGELGAELFNPNVSGRVFTAKDTSMMARNMIVASKQVKEMLNKIDEITHNGLSKAHKKSGSPYQSYSPVKIETHDTYNVTIGSGNNIGKKEAEKLFKQMVDEMWQHKSKSIMAKFGGRK